MPASRPPIPLNDVIADYLNEEWGFTGTRAGMNRFQQAMLQRILHRGQPILWRHGGAWGGDAESHRLWKKFCRKSHAEVWPSDEKRATIFRGELRTTVRDVMDPLSRNIIIVDKSKFMIAAPVRDHEEQRSGTWHTIRRAFDANRPILILWPKSQKITLYRDHVLYSVSYIVKADS